MFYCKSGSFYWQYFDKIDNKCYNNNGLDIKINQKKDNNNYNKICLCIGRKVMIMN